MARIRQSIAATCKHVTVRVDGQEARTQSKSNMRLVQLLLEGLQEQRPHQHLGKHGPV